MMNTMNTRVQRNDLSRDLYKYSPNVYSVNIMCMCYVYTVLTFKVYFCKAMLNTMHTEYEKNDLSRDLYKHSS